MIQNIQFDILKSSGINHYGKIKFGNGKELFTPMSWFGLSLIEPKDFQLEVFERSEIEAFLSNAYHLYFSDTKGSIKTLINNLEVNGYAHKMDSGGFQMMKSKGRKKTEVKLTQEKVLKKQLEIECDCGVQLDFPFGTNLSKSEKYKRIDKTLENLEILVDWKNKHTNNFSFLPVIHTVSDDLHLLNYGLERINEILGKDPVAIGIGSLVPLVKKIKGSRKNGIENMIYTLICLRKKLPNSFIHAFGIGGTMAYLAILAGIDSYDSHGWIQKAAFGVIQLPGISDRFLKKKSHRRPYLIRNRKQRGFSEEIDEVDIFMKCKCSACFPYYKKNWKPEDWKQKQNDFIGRDQESKKLRAIHNLSLYQSEVVKIREAIREDKLEQFVRERLKFSIYSKYIDFIVNLKSKSLDELNDFENLLNLENKKITDYC